MSAAETVKARQIRTGDEIEVDLGRGRLFRPVDKINEDEDKGIITVTLFSPFGVRPKITFRHDQDVIRRK